MIALTESTHAGEHILWEADQNFCRENVTVTVPADTTLLAGAVLFYSGGYYIPITAGITTGDELGILYAPLTNEDDEAANMAGVIDDKVCSVRGSDLDWNSMAHAVVDTAIALLRTQAVLVRDYTPPEDGS
jgi:hypothetical protein